MGADAILPLNLESLGGNAMLPLDLPLDLPIVEPLVEPKVELQVELLDLPIIKLLVEL